MRTVSAIGATLLTTTAALLGAACGWVPKKIEDRDCSEWSEHFEKLTRAYVAEEERDCAKKWSESGLPTAVQRERLSSSSKEYYSLLEETTKQLHDGCMSQVGKSYLKKDAECYLGAKAMHDWRNCKFVMKSYFADIADLASTFEDRAGDRCDEEIAQATVDQQALGDAGVVDTGVDAGADTGDKKNPKVTTTKKK